VHRLPIKNLRIFFLTAQTDRFTKNRCCICPDQDISGAHAERKSQSNDRAGNGRRGMIA
jgi:hypothetical protein